MKISWLAMVVAMGVSACGTSSDGGSTGPNPNPNSPPISNQSTQLFPVNPSDTWQYRLVSINPQQTVEYEPYYETVGNAELFNSITTYPINRYGGIGLNGPVGVRTFYTIESSGLFQHGMEYDIDAVSGTSSWYALNPGFKILNADFVIGDSWSTTAQVESHGPNGVTTGSREKYVSVEPADDTVVSCELIFTKCYKLHMENRDPNNPLIVDDSSDVWLAQDYGPYKINTVSSDGWTSSAELQYASVGGKVFGQAIPMVFDNILDNFDDGQLSLAWRYTLEEVSAWNYSENNSSLTVSGVTPIVNAQYPTVVLQQLLNSANNFSVNFDISWTEPDTAAATVQSVTMLLTDNNGDTILWTGYMDRWNTGTGSRLASIGTTNYFEPGQGDLTHSGSATITIARTSGNIAIAWDGATILSGSSIQPVHALELSFTHEIGGGGGTVSVDKIEFNRVP